MAIVAVSAAGVCKFSPDPSCESTLLSFCLLQSMSMAPIAWQIAASVSLLERKAMTPAHAHELGFAFIIAVAAGAFAWRIWKGW
jgi:hypothetical protein